MLLVKGEQVVGSNQRAANCLSASGWESCTSMIYSLCNIIAHHYFGINVDIVWQIISIDLPKLKDDLNLLLNQ